MVRTEDACEIIKYALQNEIKVYLDGGWGVAHPEKKSELLWIVVKGWGCGWENVNLITTADFFTPYNKDFGNVDVNWDVLISMKINKVLSATLNMTLKYDNDVKTFNDEGVERGPKVQFKEILGIGLAYNF